MASGHLVRYHVLGNSSPRRHCQSGTNLANVDGDVLTHGSYRLGGEVRPKVLVTIPDKLRIRVSNALILILFNKGFLFLFLFLHTVPYNLQETKVILKIFIYFHFFLRDRIF